MDTMAETPWTPGPWQTEYDVLEGDWGWRIKTPGADHSDVDRKADARLIAAAPEMAELLTTIAEGMTHPDSDAEWVSRTKGEARALVSRIRGES